jgi:hypothetical protein
VAHDHARQVGHDLVDLLLDRRGLALAPRSFASENSIRSRTDSAENPPKTTLCGAPMRAHASIATTTSGIIGR